MVADPIDELDDSEVQIENLIDIMVMDNVPEGYQVSAGGGLEAKAEAESFEERVQLTTEIRSLAVGSVLTKAIGLLTTLI